AVRRPGRARGLHHPLPPRPRGPTRRRCPRIAERTRRVRLIRARPPGALGPCSASAPTGQASQRPPNPPGATSSRKRPRGPDPRPAAPTPGPRPRPPARGPGPRPTELCELVAMGPRTHHFAELAPAGPVRPTELCELVAMGPRTHHFADVDCEEARW